jgi:hypothetical protein
MKVPTESDLLRLHDNCHLASTKLSAHKQYMVCLKVMRLNAWFKNWKNCSHISNTSRDLHSYLMFSASFNSIASTCAPQRLSFWNYGQHPKGHDRPAEGTSTWRLLALLTGVGTSPAVCGIPSELLWRGWCWFLVQLLIKKILQHLSHYFLDTPCILYTTTSMKRTATYKHQYVF